MPAYQRNILPIDEPYAPPRGITDVVRECAFVDREPLRERHIQCIWYDRKYRPARLRSLHGETVGVVSPGRWNLEAGPDFLDAHLRIGPDARNIRGDVEIHTHPEDWIRHGHTSDPAYAHVIAHVTYYSGHMRPGHLPAGTVQIALRDAMASMPAFHFDTIDITAYPYQRWPPDQDDRFSHLATPERQLGFIRAAGVERLRLKGIRLEHRLAHASLEQVIYEEVAGALGYRKNSIPFRQLAQHLPLVMLHPVARNDALEAYALLCGVAGLLPLNAEPGAPADTRAFIRRLWDAWWREEHTWAEYVLPPGSWDLSPGRPQNTPLRRLAALTAFAALPPDHLKPWIEARPTSPKAWLNTWMQRLNLADPIDFWSHHLSLRKPAHLTPTALLGRGRRMAIVHNIILPMRAALGHDIRDILPHLPPEQDNQCIRAAASLLLGRDHNPAVYNNDGLAQQGLLQVFHDYILNHRPGCTH